ncbi:hypothetical protein PoB_006331000 [Plakobranchus ocellatus]|uniref:Uncharacterized protein n=1 Tax=Plakobranchus ocellatus TaxID=259542 RepID=A0AAV4CY59_9GAST|nr:hypothetical protein PoB_006331000 [Plakobranchus ocellatus]
MELYPKVQEQQKLSGISRSPQQDDLRLSGPPSGQGAGGVDQTCDRRVPADLRADWLASVPPTPSYFKKRSTDSFRAERALGSRIIIASSISSRIGTNVNM